MTAASLLNHRVEIRVKYLLLCFVVGFLCFGFIGLQFSSLAEDQRQNDLRAISYDTYQAQLFAYQAAVVAHDNCVDRVATRVIVRDRFLERANLLQDIIQIFLGDAPPSPQVNKVYDAIDAERAATDVGLPLLDESICPATPLAPTPVPNPEDKS